MGGLSKFKNDIDNKTYELETDKEAFRNIVTSKIQRIMKKENITKSELSKRLKISKPAISGLLNGDRNLTIDKITSISYALGYKPSIDFYRSDYFDETGGISAFIHIAEKKTEKYLFIANGQKIYRESCYERSLAAAFQYGT